MDAHTKPTAASITAGLIDRPGVAADFGCSERTIIRYERAGMPVISLGMRRLYDPPAVRAWLMTHERRGAEPRGQVLVTQDAA